MLSDEHKGKNSWSQCKIHGHSDEEKETERMNFQGWEIGQHRMDEGHEKVEDYSRNWRKGNEGICRVGVQAVASDRRGMDEGTGESAPRNTSPPMLALKWS